MDPMATNNSSVVLNYGDSLRARIAGSLRLAVAHSLSMPWEQRHFLQALKSHDQGLALSRARRGLWALVWLTFLGDVLQ